MRRRESGVALITIMLIVAVATILAVQMATDQSLAIDRAESIIDNAQVREYAYGGEELARQILFESLKKDPTRVTMSQDWASDKLQYDYDQGHIDLRIRDLQGRLNINSLLAPGAAGAAARARFAALFAHQGVDPAFIDRIMDWIDPDQARRPMGAEDYDYLGLDHPYRAANQPMEDPTELRLLIGMDKKTWLAIAPYVCALPDPMTTVNVNTAPPAVLQAIAPGLTDSQAKAIAEARDAGKGYDNVQSFIGNPANPFPPQINQTGLGVQSSYFEVDVRARYRDRFAYLTSIIQRNRADGSMRVIYRNLSRKTYPVVAGSQSSSGDSGGSSSNNGSSNSSGNASGTLYNNG